MVKSWNWEFLQVYILGLIFVDFSFCSTGKMKERGELLGKRKWSFGFVLFRDTQTHVFYGYDLLFFFFALQIMLIIFHGQNILSMIIMIKSLYFQSDENLN